MSMSLIKEPTKRCTSEMVSTTSVHKLKNKKQGERERERNA